MNLARIGLFTFLFYLVFLIVLTFYLGLTNDGYSFLTGDMSDLGRRVSGGGDDFFNVIISVFGILNMFFIWELKEFLSKNSYSNNSQNRYTPPSRWINSFGNDCRNWEKGRD